MSTQFSELENLFGFGFNKCQIGTEDNSKNHNKDQIFFFKSRNSFFLFMCGTKTGTKKYVFPLETKDWNQGLTKG
jgi:hypothetical protein